LRTLVYFPRLTVYDICIFTPLSRLRIVRALTTTLFHSPANLLFPNALISYWRVKDLILTKDQRLDSNFDSICHEEDLAALKQACEAASRLLEELSEAEPIKDHDVHQLVALELKGPNPRDSSNLRFRPASQQGVQQGEEQEQQQQQQQTPQTQTETQTQLRTHIPSLAPVRVGRPLSALGQQNGSHSGKTDGYDGYATGITGSQSPSRVGTPMALPTVLLSKDMTGVSLVDEATREVSIHSLLISLDSPHLTRPFILTWPSRLLHNPKRRFSGCRLLLFWHTKNKQKKTVLVRREEAQKAQLPNLPDSLRDLSGISARALETENNTRPISAPAGQTDAQRVFRAFKGEQRAEAVAIASNERFTRASSSSDAQALAGGPSWSRALSDVAVAIGPSLESSIEDFSSRMAQSHSRSVSDIVSTYKANFAGKKTVNPEYSQMCMSLVDACEKISKRLLLPFREEDAPAPLKSLFSEPRRKQRFSDAMAYVHTLNRKANRHAEVVTKIDTIIASFWKAYGAADGITEIPGGQADAVDNACKSHQDSVSLAPFSGQRLDGSVYDRSVSADDKFDDSNTVLTVGSNSVGGQTASGLLSTLREPSDSQTPAIELSSMSHTVSVPQPIVQNNRKSVRKTSSQLDYIDTYVIPKRKGILSGTGGVREKRMLGARQGDRSNEPGVRVSTRVSASGGGAAASAIVALPQIGRQPSPFQSAGVVETRQLS
jgi:hypothetical protein